MTLNLIRTPREVRNDDRLDQLSNIINTLCVALYGATEKEKEAAATHLKTAFSSVVSSESEKQEGDGGTAI